MQQLRQQQTTAQTLKTKLGNNRWATVVQLKQVSGILTDGNITTTGSEVLHSVTLALPLQFQQPFWPDSCGKPVKEVPPNNIILFA